MALRLERQAFVRPVDAKDTLFGPMALTYINASHALSLYS